MTAPDVHLAVGAYALHSLPDDERAEFRAHLDECDSCARELAEFRATLALVAELAAERPPAGLRERVLSIPATTRQLPPLAGSVVPLRRPWYRRPVSWIAAAVAAVAVAGGLTAILRQPPPDAAEQAAACVRTAPDRSEHAAATGTGSVVAAASCRAATVDLSALSALPADRSYQLWIMTGERPRPAGLVSVAGNGTAAPVVTGLTDADTALALTVEPAGGSPQPTSDPIWVTPLR